MNPAALILPAAGQPLAASPPPPGALTLFRRAGGGGAVSKTDARGFDSRRLGQPLLGGALNEAVAGSKTRPSAHLPDAAFEAPQRPDTGAATTRAASDRSSAGGFRGSPRDTLPGGRRAGSGKAPDLPVGPSRAAAAARAF